jgi:hypothetical protein
VRVAVRQARALIERVVAELDPAVLDTDLAVGLVDDFAALGRIVAAGEALAARRVASSTRWKHEGHRSPAHWLAAHTGTAVGSAATTLETVERLERLPQTDTAFRSGTLSTVQVSEIAAAASADPCSEGALLASARHDGLAGLKRECARVKAAACDDEIAREARIRASRSFRHWTDTEGAFCYAGRTTVTEGAELLACIEPHRERIFREARTHGRREPLDAYASDALLAALRAGRNGDAAGGPGPKALIHVRVDHAALVRGHTEAGEVCEIAGLGSIPVATARSLAGDALLKALAVDGVDVLKVAHVGRSIPARVRTALEERDGECVVPGCHVRANLEIDHFRVDFADGGPTEMWNLARECAFHHHHQRTHKGFVLDGSPGDWTWIHPDGTVQRECEPGDDRAPP